MAVRQGPAFVTQGSPAMGAVDRRSHYCDLGGMQRRELYLLMPRRKSRGRGDFHLL
jgi:hypothetical protein